MTAETLLDCGHATSAHGEFTTGYGEDKGKKYCYDCCAARDRAHMVQDGRAVLYLTYNKHNDRESAPRLSVGCLNECGYQGATPEGGSPSAWEVTNWPGSLRFNAFVRRGGHNIARYRWDAWFTDHTGAKWHGVQYGQMSQLVHCRRLK